MLRLWIETGAPYPGTYAALGCGMIGGYAQNQQVHTDFDWPTTQAGAGGHRAPLRLLPHRATAPCPASLSDERGISFWRFDLNDPRLRSAAHRVQPHAARSSR